MWQQNTLKGRAIAWPDYVAAVRAPDQGPSSAGVAFWLRYDLKRILGVWAAEFGADRTHVVIVPPTQAPPRELFERFAAATGIETKQLRLPDKLVNRSPDPVSTELIRRLNARMRDDLTEHEYLQLIRRLRPSLRPSDASHGGPSFLPDHSAWVSECSEALISHLRDFDYQIVGDLDDLRPRFDEPECEETSAVSDSVLVGRALAVLDFLLREPAERRARTHADDPAERTVSALGRWGSWLRASTFQGRRKLLDHADRSRWIARAANIYLRRSGRVSSRRLRPAESSDVTSRTSDRHP
jgi:hypothetical protein